MLVVTRSTRYPCLTGDMGDLMIHGRHGGNGWHRLFAISVYMHDFIGLGCSWLLMRGACYRRMLKSETALTFKGETIKRHRS